MHRQRAEIGVLAFQHHLLDRRILGFDLHRLDRIREPLRQLRHQAGLIGVERQRQPLARRHHVANQLRLLRTDRLEPYRARVAFQHRGNVDEIDRLVVNVALAELHQPLDKAAQAEAFGVGGGHARQLPWHLLSVAGYIA